VLNVSDLMPEQQLGRGLEAAAPVLFVDRLLTDAEMPGLFAAASHYWSMSHGEGWDQPLRFGRTVEDLAARLRELGFLLFTLTPDGPRRYERVGELPVNVLAVRRLVTLLDGLPERQAAELLRALPRRSAGPTVG
jgi:hypothetical protein